MMRVIAGPCMMESEELVMTVADELVKICERAGVELCFKASFDKANRTSAKSARGPGLEKGMEWMAKVKEKHGIKVVTDIHESYQAAPVAEVCDILQIPAFLCRQTDLLVAAAKTGRIINIKKAQFLAPWDMKNVVEKMEAAGNRNIMLCERGTTFGYNRLVVDMTGIIEMKRFGYPVIFDATHSVQKPGGQGTSTGGNREYVEPLAKAAMAVGADGLFFEVHPDPDHALSDGPNMLKLSDFEAVLNRVLRVRQAVQEG
ncbi:3-deoxy-8-phosphooctulonate synthase [Pseudoflavonifractor capillosus]|uniref:3-deoxy-8-phosphooctulonate synthase n=1 Tax=Pseudoflavonifractor capillosus TaxID=106588 RepID=UPI001958FB83|nr:3-deoxy-8-phosphooctulonate synthase [Pseudoflavonifractor capillosus]MBM6896589.1 3-deoxy-8-phosphooctulonate synthase [Pseudoflavonifractor capillosus]